MPVHKFLRYGVDEQAMMSIKYTLGLAATETASVILSHISIQVTVGTSKRKPKFKTGHPNPTGSFALIPECVRAAVSHSTILVGPAAALCTTL